MLKQKVPEDSYTVDDATSSVMQSSVNDKMFSSVDVSDCTETPRPGRY